MFLLGVALLSSCAAPLGKTYLVSYDGNGATGGEAPKDNTSYQAGATATVLGNTGSLAKAGYSFSSWNTSADGSGTSYAAGASLTMGSANVTLYAYWTAILPVTLLAIPGVPAPTTRISPVTSVDASQYTGSISWSPAVSGSFASGTIYTATITLTPKTGYTLTGVRANSFTAAGATATNGADSGVVTAVFPTTTDATTNLALNCPVTVSSAQSAYPGTLLVDGKTGTEWGASSGSAAWFSVDLGKAQAIKTIKLYPDFALSGTLKFSIQGSNDGTTWVDIKNPVSYSVTLPVSNTANIYALTDLDIQCRYLKVTSITWQGWVAALEFQVYGY